MPRAKVILKGGPNSGWYAPPKGTHTGEAHRSSGSGKSTAAVGIGDVQSGKKFDKVPIQQGSKRIGYIQYRKMGAKIHVNEIVVDQEARGHGVGSGALRALMDRIGVDKVSVGTLTESGRRFFQGLSNKGWSVEFKD